MSCAARAACITVLANSAHKGIGMRAHLAVSYTDDLSAEAIDAVADELARPGLLVQKMPRPAGGAYAALEWLIPTAVFAYIAKSYFDGFLKEAGKDHYQLLRGGLKKLAGRFTGPGAERVTLISTKGKIDGSGPSFSRLYSVVGELNDGIVVKLLIPTDTGGHEVDRAVDAFLDFLWAVHNGTSNADAVRGLADAKPVGKTLLVSFDSASGALRVVDPIPKHLRDAQAAAAKTEG